MVTLHTSHGDIVLQLAYQEAPNTVANFLRYSHQGFYNNTLFHRVIKDFMIQGGGFGPSMQQKETADPIPNEANNQLLNRRGTIAMARTSDPHSATAQFFINVKDNGFLNFRAETPQGWGYCVFGEVIAGLSVVDQIAAVETGPHSSGHQDLPKQAVVITRVTVADPSPNNE